MTNRRDFLKTLAGGALVSLGGCGASSGAATGTSPPDPYPRSPDPKPREPLNPLAPTRGAIILVDDLSLSDWPERAAAVGLNTFSFHTHDKPSLTLAPFFNSRAGRQLLDRCGALGLDTEFEMHCMDDLLPRDLFATRPEVFRMNADCQRTPDNNLCVHSDALKIAADNALKLAALLPPTTGRYFLWPDDGAAWCECKCCKPVSFTDQQLTLENYLLAALRTIDSNARIAHLAYLQTLEAPVEVTPAAGVFLEFAPINRRYDIPLDTPGDPVQRQHLAALDANLAVFGKQGAKALEYWLDVSKASYWTRPARPLIDDESLMRDDIVTYRARGVADISTFAAWLDADYVARFGARAISDYGAALNSQ